MHRVFRPARSACAAALILAHLLLVTAAASPRFHAWLHGDADAPDHECAVTAYVDGQLDHPAPLPVFISPAGPAFVATMVIPPVRLLEGTPVRASRERAPPVA